MANGIKATQESVINTLGVITKTVRDFTERFEDLRKNNTEELLEMSEIIEKKMEVFEGFIQATHMNFSQEIENHRKNFIELQGKSERPVVGFHVHHVTDVNPNTNQKIVFDSIITNEGSGYDTSTGIFTAPVGGLYHLAVHFCTPNKRYSSIALVHADNAISKEWIYGSEGVSCRSVGGVVRVKYGERVWVKVLNGGSSYKLYQDSNTMNSFSY